MRNKFFQRLISIVLILKALVIVFERNKQMKKTFAFVCACLFGLAVVGCDQPAATDATPAAPADETPAATAPADETATEAGPAAEEAAPAAEEAAPAAEEAAPEVPAAE